MKYKFLLLIFFFLSPSVIIGLFGQSINLPDKIIVYKNDQNKMVTDYVVQAKNTLYSISKAYHIDITELQSTNPDFSILSLAPGDTLTIPFRKSLIDVLDPSASSTGLIPIYYKTVKKDNLFRIARVYFDQYLEELMRRNDMKSIDIQLGQLIHIGWKSPPQAIKYSEQASVEEKESVKVDPPKVLDPVITPPSKPDIVKKSTEEVETEVTLADSLSGSQETEHIIQQNGLAIWDKNSQLTGIFALHNQAKIGTLLEVKNPLLNRKEFVKVIGKIPGNSYQEKVKVILSPEAARSLGALDSRFYVKMNYIKD